MSTARKPSIVFFGNERLATGVTTTAPTLQLLIDAGYHIAAVVSHYEHGKSRNVRDLEIAKVAETHGIPLLLPEKPADITDQLQAYDAPLGVLVAYGKIVPQSVIDVFPKGIVNIHPSLLPLHRGPTPIESVILKGAAETGVSIMKLVRDMDAGPVYDQTRITLSGTETKQELADTLLAHGGKMLVEVLPGILDGSLPAKSQDDAQATYDVRLDKQAGVLDFTKSAEQLEREIRAYAAWPKSRMTIGGKDVIITKAHAVPSDYGDAGDIDVIDPAIGFTIQCTHGYLCVDRLKPAGKQEMTAVQFLAGYGHLLQK